MPDSTVDSVVIRPKTPKEGSVTVDVAGAITLEHALSAAAASLTNHGYGDAEGPTYYEVVDGLYSIRYAYVS